MPNYIYKYEYHSKVSDSRYKYEVEPFDNAVIEEPIYIDLPIGVVKLKEIDTGFEKYPIGILKTAIMKADLDLSILNQETTDVYDRFIAAIYNPAIDVEIDENLTIQGYTIHRLYKTNSEDEFELVFEGGQKIGIEGNFDLLKNNIEIEIEEIQRCVIEQIPTDWFAKKYKNYEEIHYSRNVVIDGVVNSYYKMIDYNFGGQPETVTIDRLLYFIYPDTIIDSGVTKFYFYPFVDFINYIGTVFFEIYYKLAQKEPEFSAFAGGYSPLFGNITYFKNELDYVEPTVTASRLLLGAICHGDDFDSFKNDGEGKIYSGFLSINDENSLQKLYSNMWDFLADYTENECSKLVWNYPIQEVKMMPIFGYEHLYSGEVFDLNELYQRSELIDCKLSLGKMSVNKIDVGINETKNEDIDSIVIEKNLSRNGNTFNLNILFNNIPQTPLFNEKICGDERYFSTYSSQKIIKEPQKPDGYHVLNYYCFADTISDIETADSIILTHPFIRVQLTDTVDSESIYPPADIINPIDASPKPTEYMIELQRISCKPNILSKVLSEVFSKKNISELVVRFKFDSLEQKTHFRDAFITKYQFDLSQINSNLSYIGSDWLCTNTKLDFESEEVELTLINKVI